MTAPCLSFWDARTAPRRRPATGSPVGSPPGAAPARPPPLGTRSSSCDRGVCHWEGTQPRAGPRQMACVAALGPTSALSCRPASAWMAPVRRSEKEWNCPRESQRTWPALPPPCTSVPRPLRGKQRHLAASARNTPGQVCGEGGQSKGKRYTGHSRRGFSAPQGSC
jgi:hypothetical protein